MKKEKEVMRKVKESHIVCDFCGKRINYNYRGHAGCIICGRDACKKHLHLEDVCCGGDGYDAYCLSCWEIGKPLREQMRILEEEFDEKIEKLQSKWEFLAQKEAEK